MLLLYPCRGEGVASTPSHAVDLLCLELGCLATSRRGVRVTIYLPPSLLSRPESEAGKKADPPTSAHGVTHTYLSHSERSVRQAPAQATTS